MPNSGHHDWMQRAMDEAMDRLVKDGLDNADPKDVQLATTAFLAEKITARGNGRRRKRDYVTPVLERGTPWAVAIGLVLYTLERAGG